MIRNERRGVAYKYFPLRAAPRQNPHASSSSVSSPASSSSTHTLASPAPRRMRFGALPVSPTTVAGGFAIDPDTTTTPSPSRSY